MDMIYLDFETQSKLDLRKVGVYRYARDCDPVCMSYAIDDGPVKRWIKGDVFPQHLFSGDLCAHNFTFERLILKHCFGIETRFQQWHCTQAIAQSQSLPGSLEDLGQYFGIPKDMKGNRVMLKLSKPKRGGAFWTSEEKPEDFEVLYQYCDRDVEITRQFYHLMRPMTAFEKRVWYHTQKINERGLLIDSELIEPALDLLGKEFHRYDQEVKALVGCGVNQVGKLAKAVGVDSVAANKVRQILERGDLSQIQRRVLELRQKVGKSSIRKLPAIDRMRCGDDRIRGTLTYAGAERTGRWSGRGIQPQNLPRGYSGEKLDNVIAILRNHGTLDDAHESISQSLKGFIKGPFIVADYSQIECRVLAYLAGQVDLLQTFVDQGDPYKLMASKVYNKDTDSITKDERFYGKQLTLGCGYGLGYAKFKRMLFENYAVEISEDRAQFLVSVYRRSNAKIIQFWSRCQRAFTLAIKGQRLRYKGLEFGREDGAVYIKLLSGRCLWYHKPEIVGGDIRYFGRNQYTTKYEQVKTYGGKITENICQSVSRDLMAIAMWNLEKAGFPIVLTVHDEIVAEQNTDDRIDEFNRIMTETPSWANGLPLAVESKWVERYQK